MSLAVSTKRERTLIRRTCIQEPLSLYTNDIHVHYTSIILHNMMYMYTREPSMYTPFSDGLVPTYVLVDSMELYIIDHVEVFFSFIFKTIDMGQLKEYAY